MKQVDVMAARIREAQTREALEKLAEQLKPLPTADRDALRPLFNKRLGEVTRS
jgi:hypothetical protein